MLDHTPYLTSREGIVRFTNQAAQYVPRKPGIYRIFAIPFSYASPELETTSRYFDIMNRSRLVHRDNLSATFSTDRNGNHIRIFKRMSPISVTSSQAHQNVPQMASFFPPFYIGKANVLRNRFLEHASGINSHIRDDLHRIGLSHFLSFFHWHLCDASDLQYTESILIQAHRPIMNRTTK